MQGRLAWIGIILVGVLAIPSIVMASEYDHRILLKNMSFEWRIDGAHLNIQLKAKTKGWVAIGFNTEGSMKNADLILGYVKRGKVKISDQFGIRSEEHIRDIVSGGADNIQNIKGSERFSQTTISFSIPLKSGDSKDFAIDPTREVMVLLAFGRGQDNFHSKHAFRTALKVNLSTGKYRK